MNPFFSECIFDPVLKDILNRLVEKSNPINSLKDLIECITEHEPKKNIVDIKIALTPFISYNNLVVKNLVNCAFYKILTWSPIKQFKDIQCEWMYHNIGADDEYAQKIFAEYFTVLPIEKKLYSYITWDNLIPDLSCFLYSIERSVNEYDFDPKMLELSTDYELDKIKAILKILRKRSMITRLTTLSPKKKNWMV